MMLSFLVFTWAHGPSNGCKECGKSQINKYIYIYIYEHHNLTKSEAVEKSESTSGQKGHC